MIALIAAFFLQAQTVTDAGPWCDGVDDSTNWVMDTTWDCTQPFFSSTHELSISQIQRWTERACRIWGRATLATRQCRAKATPQDVWFHPFIDSYSSAGFPNYPSLSENAATNCNTSSGVDLSWFCGKQWRTCMVDSGYGTCTGSLSLGSQGRVNQLSFHSVTTHEIGHFFGLNHPEDNDACSFKSCEADSDCPGTEHCDGLIVCPPGIICDRGEGVCLNDDIICPVMTGGSRDAWWPTSVDTETIRRGRELAIRYADVDANGVLGLASGGCIFNVDTWTVPYVSCRPNTTAGDDCVVSWRDSTNGGQSFSFIDTAATTCAVTATYESSFRSDVAADVSWGSGQRVIAVGNRPAKLSRQGQLVWWVATPSGIESTNFAGDSHFSGLLDNDSVSTYTEPAISFHETNKRQMVAYVDMQGHVRVLSLDEIGRAEPSRPGLLCLSGADCGDPAMGCDSGVCRGKVCAQSTDCSSPSQPRDNIGCAIVGPSAGRCIIEPIDTGFKSMLPPEIICDTHATSDFNFCLLLNQPHSTDDSIQSGDFLRSVITFQTGGIPIHNTTGILESGPQASFLSDAGSFGNGRTASQPDLDGFWLVSQNFSDVSPLENRFSFDEASTFATPTDTFFSMQSYQPEFYRVSTTTMDWNETVHKFVIASARGY